MCPKPKVLFFEQIPISRGSSLKASVHEQKLTFIRLVWGQNAAMRICELQPTSPHGTGKWQVNYKHYYISKSNKTIAVPVQYITRYQTHALAHILAQAKQHKNFQFLRPGYISIFCILYYIRRKIRLIEGKAKCHLKQLHGKGLCGGYLSVWGPLPPRFLSWGGRAIWRFRIWSDT